MSTLQDRKHDPGEYNKKNNEYWFDGGIKERRKARKRCRMSPAVEEEENSSITADSFKHLKIAEIKERLRQFNVPRLHGKKKADLIQLLVEYTSKDK